MNASKHFPFQTLFFPLRIAFCCVMLYFSPLSAQQRGISIVATDNKTNEWKEIFLYNKVYAVIIGIDRYPGLPQDRQLSYAVSDAKAVERMLRDKFVFHEIHALYNEQATRNNVMDILLNKLSETTPEDAVFVFYAGHGGQEKTAFGEIGFIVPYDGDFSDMRKVISMTTIRDDISKRIKAKHVFYVMDACYSGLLVMKRGEGATITRREIAYLQEIAKEPVRQVLTAGDEKQQVLDGGPGGHSVFTGRFLEILDSVDDFITATEISARVKEKVFSDANARGHIQTPKSGELFGLGDFIFMPSLSKRQVSIQQQITELESELGKINELEAKAKQIKDEAAVREAQRQRLLAEAKLKAKKLEEERLEQERLQNAQRETQRQQMLEAQKKQQEEEETRLANLKLAVEEKRKGYKTSMTLSLDGAIQELQSLNKQIYEIKTGFLNELKNRILRIAENSSKGFATVTLEKDEFETRAEYQARLAQHSQSSQSSNQSEFGQAMATIKTAYENQIAPLVQQIETISASEYTIYGHDALVIALGNYNADGETFKITIASKNITRPIYTEGRFLFISEAGYDERNAGIQKGDMIVKYNNTIVPPYVNWERLKQTVLADYAEIEVDRNGQTLKFWLPKGRFEAETYVDDYAGNLQSNQFLVNGDLYVPRTEARKFKQDHLNGFVTAELQVRSISPYLSLVTNAVVDNESDDKKYDLFKSRLINMGRRLTYDTMTQTLWATITWNKLSWYGANKFAVRLTYRGIEGWRLPTFSEMQGLRSTLAYWYFNNFSNETFHTATLTPDRSKHSQYIPSRNEAGWGGDNDWRHFVTINSLSSIKNIGHGIFDDRFIKLDNDMVFDTYNRLIWTAKPVSAKALTWLEAEKYVKELNYFGLQGWRLPSFQEFSSLYDHAIPGIDRVFNFSEETFHTGTWSDDRRHHIQYRPYRNERGWDDDSNSRYLICVM